MQFFAPQVAALIRERDAILAPKAAESSWANVLDDRSIEVVASLPVAPEAQMLDLRNQLSRFSPE